MNLFANVSFDFTYRASLGEKELYGNFISNLSKLQLVYGLV